MYDIFRGLGNVSHKLTEKPGKELCLFQLVQMQPLVDEIGFLRLELSLATEDIVICPPPNSSWFTMGNSIMKYMNITISNLLVPYAVYRLDSNGFEESGCRLR